MTYSDTSTSAALRHQRGLRSAPEEDPDPLPWRVTRPTRTRVPVSKSRRGTVSCLPLPTFTVSVQEVCGKLQRALHPSRVPVTSESLPLRSGRGIATYTDTEVHTCDRGPGGVPFTRRNTGPSRRRWRVPRRRRLQSPPQLDLARTLRLTTHSRRQ